MDSLMTVFDAMVNGLAHGVLAASWWQVLLFTLVVTHITIAAVTIYLHRAQAHRALDLHPAVSHFFRFWLWLTTGMVTREWVAIHRKHHAKCETEEDPHSPQTRGIKTVLLQGAELYRAESKNMETISKFSHGTPDDWIERNLYTRYSWQGVGLMLLINLTLFGAIGAAVWAVQMLWIPINAAGIINGLGHWWGYRNFEAPDASTNISPWGVMIGGEELHNNHHTYPTSAKFSVKPYEFDIGWVYISLLSKLGLATVRKTAPELKLGAIRPVADGKTLEAVIANRYELMAKYGREMRRHCRAELKRLKADGHQNTPKWARLTLAKRWAHRDDDRIPNDVRPQLQSARAEHPVLDKFLTMREELRQLWTRTNVSAEQLVIDLQAWCKKAEESGVAALQEFSLKLRAAHA
ncbi:DesA family fatty acid desaturase [Rivibacter subsaxonicus]|uniref:Stearoyl-CoA desaturase (Delta-9 desaturase) n=1 Tax=Rivibacter subsaxonicus TaxID=457575 RepID=A0A4Q7VH31_9BURK|nr:fatty acid desaturase [Rivibacter subsaxonicus]RZT95334.1 stearoyl-CoA desaturase (delta-9 desaturase) [Rivibacter subsaxonicus]